MKLFNRLMTAAMVLLFLSVAARAEPGMTWERADPDSLGWSREGLRKAEHEAGSLATAAVMIVQDGRLVASFGDAARKVSVASVRKSFLGALYGIAVSEGRIDLDSTLARLRIDDIPPGLTETEKGATVRDLLMARSGIYHPAAHETASIRKNRPKRASHPPGSFWFYNNWDFNALGTIYRQQTGEDIFKSFATRIATPIGMEDFSVSDGRYVQEDVSLHPAYPFRASARDMARFGLLYLNKGRWNGKQVVPAEWITASTTTYSHSERGKLGYGYLWWTLPARPWGDGAAFAAGHGGQYIAIIPAKRLVVVETVDRRQNPKGVRTSDFLRLLRGIVAAAP